MRIALLTHSTNPRGGVVHAMHLGDALHDLGHTVAVHAPDPHAKGFARRLRCRAVSVRAEPVSEGLAALVRRRIGEYVEHFERQSEPFDVYHAQDAISANALATLVERGSIRGYVRTVHHLDEFEDPYLGERQARSVSTADRVFCVSRTWVDVIKRDFGIDADEVSNGVDTHRFHPTAAARDRSLAEQFEINGRPVLLAVGGIESRKNTVNLLAAFLQFRVEEPAAQLVIVGGASLLDHSSYRAAFDALLESAGPAARDAVRLVGVVADDAMPAIFRAATALVFPSVKEGFGLVVLEALASGTPVVTSRVPPFTEYLGETDVCWCDPSGVSSIVDAMRQATAPGAKTAAAVAGPVVAAKFSWERSARRHAELYARVFKESDHARDAIPRSLAR